jgi:hypothetical protein
MKILLLSILLCLTIDSTNVSSLVKYTERNCKESYKHWTFVPIADYPVFLKGVVRVPDLSQGKIYCCKQGIGGIVWVSTDTACILVKSWINKTDTTYRFIWYILDQGKWSSLK